MRQIVLILIINLIVLNGVSQSITGNLSLSLNQSISLEGFNGLNTYLISTTKIDERGKFKILYSKADFGIGFLMIENEKPMLVLLNGEDIEIIGESLSYLENIKAIKGKENQAFFKYAKEHPHREQVLNAWKYLEKIYNLNSLFSKDKKTKRLITKKYNKIKQVDQDFLTRLDPKSYIGYYLPIRSLISDVSIIAQYRTEEIPKTINSFRNLDYTDYRLYRSGLLKDAIESHFWLIENSGKSLDSVFIEMKISIDSMFRYLIKDEKKLNEITDYLFDLLEKHSLFKASEYLALKVLNEVNCSINNDLAKQLETYRVMKKGNIAPDLFLTGYKKWIDKEIMPEKLSQIKSDYLLVVYGAGWCNKCIEEIPKITDLYKKWKENGVEVVFISLDENQEKFKEFSGSFPFLSVCDFKKWESPMAKDYYVFSTPTMFLLNNKREILLRPNSVKQMDTWVDWFLINNTKNE
jgi:thiol-disulfide isomerase/thioredoxin